MKNKEKRNILIIEDSESAIAMLTRVLTSEYNINVAMNGRDGIEIAKKTRPDVIILDIVMPDIDGFEAITILKKAVSTRYIPVIFITSLTNIEDEERGLALGGSDYITKPFSDAIVKLRVKNQIRMLDYINTIEKLSRIDQLTGLPNRRSFHERLQSEWKLAVREGNILSILIIDIDHFKKCNDTFGHLMGDTVLQKVAKSIMTNIKKPTDFVARWGGEEFIALLPKTESAGAVYVAELIRKAVENLVVTFNDGRSTSVTVSAGVNTHRPTKQCSLNNFLHYADDALYAAKRNGRNNVYVHQPESENNDLNIVF
jgi:diguanylate cyclase (GGDEF)-like protein